MHGIVVNDIVTIRGLTIKDFYIEIDSLNVYRKDDVFRCTLHLIFYSTQQKLSTGFMSEHKTYSLQDLSNLVPKLLNNVATDANYKKYEII